ncbi:MAG: LTA synthase family protein, partial [Myxococcota bacterium]
MHATLDGNQRTLSEAAERASLLLAGVVLVCMAKLVRGVQLWHDGGGVEALVSLPFLIGQDLLDVGVVSLCGMLMLRALRRQTYERTIQLGVLSWALLCALDVTSYRVTGTGITWQRLGGAEGSTLADLDLLSMADLGVGVSCALCFASLHPAVRAVVARWHWLWGVAPSWVALVLMLGGGLLMGVEHHRRIDRWELRRSTLQLFVGSLLEGNEDRVDVHDDMTEVDWARLHTPAEVSLAPASVPRTDEVPRNVIIVLMEGVPFRYTSWGTAGFDSTPNLRRRVEAEGQLFRRFYSHYHSSIQSIFSLVCSAYPPMYVREGNIVSQAPRIDCGEFSEHMRDSGRKTGLFHGGRFAYYDKLSLLGGRGYDVTLDAEHLRRRYPERQMHKWGIDDRAVVESTLDWIDSVPAGQHFAALLIPITAHYPYWLPRDVVPRFPGEGKPERFASAVSYLDDAVEVLLRGLESRGLYEETLVVVLADHGERVDPLAHKYGGFRVFYEQNLHVPFLLLNPRLFPAGTQPRVSDRLGGIVDVVPTVLDALRLRADPRHFGQSLLADDFADRRVFFGSFSARETAVGFI